MTDHPTLEWINARPEGTDDAVIEDISKSLADLKSPEQLHYHTVFLGDDMDSTPGVIVTGEAGNPNFVCEYFPVIGDAFETARPNADAAHPETAEGSSDPDTALKVFLRGRGGKASASNEDHPLGHNAIANGIAENEQDKGA